MTKATQTSTKLEEAATKFSYGCDDEDMFGGYQGFIAGASYFKEAIIKELKNHVDGSDVRDDQINEFIAATIKIINEKYDTKNS